MHSKLVALTLAGSGASAFVLPRGDGCCFEVTASGGKSGTVGQLGDGQNRVGGSYSPATYCINNGGITDSNGRGCILTPPTTQFQCDSGASPTTGFSISSEGEIQYNGSSKFYACGAAPSEYNIYTTAVEGQKDCVEVALSSGGKCSGNDNGGGASSSQASVPAGSTSSSKPVNEKSTAPAPSSEAKPSSYALPSSGAATTPAGSQSKPSAPATGSGEAPPPPEGTHTPSAPASKPSSQGQASSPPAVPSQPSPPATQESKPSAPATNVPDTSASVPASSMPAASMPAASMPAASPSTPAECQPSTVTVTVTQGCEAPSASAPVVAPSGGVPASSPNGSPSGAVPSAPPAGSAPPAAPSSVASSPNGSPSGAIPSAPPAGSAPPPYASSVASSPNGSPSAPPTGSAPPSPAGSAASPSGGSPSGAMPSAPPSGSAPPYPSSAAPSTDSSKPPAVIPSGQAPSGSGSNAGPSAPATPTASGSACQTSLSGAYQTPHLIVPISSEQPDEAYGTNYNGQINSTTSTIFNFDIPQDYEGKQCSIIFLFPKKEDLETSSYDFGGSGSLDCTELSSAADQKTSYSNAPSVKKDLGSLELQPGNSYVVATQDCQAGTTQSIELSSQDGLNLNFFEDWNPSPLGLYITSC